MTSIQSLEWLIRIHSVIYASHELTYSKVNKTLNIHKAMRCCPTTTKNVASFKVNTLKGHIQTNMTIFPRMTRSHVPTWPIEIFEAPTFHHCRWVWIARSDKDQTFVIAMARGPCCTREWWLRLKLRYLLTPNFLSNQFMVDRGFLPYINNPLDSFTHNQNNYKHQVNVHICT